jgi:lysophospholipase
MTNEDIFDRRKYPGDSTLDSVAAPDGWPLRRFRWPAESEPAGSILFQGGRGDIIEKYLEAFAHWHARGWDVTAFDWRGQGGSGRLSANATVGHANSFARWVDDLAAFVKDWSAMTPGPHVVIGHSMGGHLILRALSERRIRPDAAVLIAPMLGFETGRVPLPLAAGLVRMASALAPERPAWKTNERPAPAGASRQQFLTSDSARYEDEIWWKREKPELGLGPPSLKWLEQAYSSCVALAAPGTVEHIRTPMLILGTRGDRLVSPAAIPRFAERIPSARLKMFDESVAHEILRERDGPRDEALAEIDALLDAAKARA